MSSFDKIEKRVSLRAPISRVWRAITEAKEFGRWFGVNLDGDFEAQHYFSFRWVPYGIDAEIDLRTEPTTLVEFRLEEAPEGTVLTIVESGFDRVPAHRRERAFRMNDGGWTIQAENIKKHVEET